MKLIEVNNLKRWIENWFDKNKYYHPYSKSENIPKSELYDILDQIETVKAIPIEYIEKFKKEFRAVASVKAVIEWLLENWEKENGAKESVRNTGI